MPELKTEPGWKPPISRRPWWASALIAGVSLGLTVLGGFALQGGPARGQEPRVATAGVALPAGTLSLDERLSRMESAIEGLKHEVFELRDRLPPKR